MNTWHIYRQDAEPHDDIENLPAPPMWRSFPRQKEERGKTFCVTSTMVEMVNAAIYLRRPLLVTGAPGTGKSSLAYSIAYQLQLGEVLHWPINSRSTLKEGLYSYDAIGRLQAANLQRSRPTPGSNSDQEPPGIGRFIHLGPLGTALLPADKPHVLLIDEIDKGDIDLPNDLLHVFEEGSYIIPELFRLPDGQRDISVYPWRSPSSMGTNQEEERVQITRGRVECREFPIIILTSNQERQLPPAFLRRCLLLDIDQPTPEELEQIVKAHLDLSEMDQDLVNELIEDFCAKRDQSALATDQLLNAIYLVGQDIDVGKLYKEGKEDKDSLISKICTALGYDQ